MADVVDLTGELPHGERIRSARLKHGVAMVIVDASGLSKAEAEAMEQELRSATAEIPGVTEARIALTVAEPARHVQPGQRRLWPVAADFARLVRKAHRRG